MTYENSEDLSIHIVTLSKRYSDSITGIIGQLQDTLPKHGCNDTLNKEITGQPDQEQLQTRKPDVDALLKSRFPLWEYTSCCGSHFNLKGTARRLTHLNNGHAQLITERCDIIKMELKHTKAQAKKNKRASRAIKKSIDQLTCINHAYMQALERMIVLYKIDLINNLAGKSTLDLERKGKYKVLQAHHQALKQISKAPEGLTRSQYREYVHHITDWRLEYPAFYTRIDYLKERTELIIPIIALIMTITSCGFFIGMPTAGCIAILAKWSYIGYLPFLFTLYDVANSLWHGRRLDKQVIIDIVITLISSLLGQIPGLAQVISGKSYVSLAGYSQGLEASRQLFLIVTGMLSSLLLTYRPVIDKYLRRGKHFYERRIFREHVPFVAYLKASTIHFYNEYLKKHAGPKPQGKTHDLRELSYYTPLLKKYRKKSGWQWRLWYHRHHAKDSLSLQHMIEDPKHSDQNQTPLAIQLFAILSQESIEPTQQIRALTETLQRHRANPSGSFANGLKYIVLRKAHECKKALDPADKPRDVGGGARIGPANESRGVGGGAELDPAIKSRDVGGGGEPNTTITPEDAIVSAHTERGGTELDPTIVLGNTGLASSGV